VNPACKQSLSAGQNKRSWFLTTHKAYEQGSGHSFTLSAVLPKTHTSTVYNSPKKVHFIFAITGKTIKIRGLFQGSLLAV